MNDLVIESFWDLSYESGDYLEHWESPHTPQELVAVVAAGLIPPGGTVLDVGCGAGAEALFLARQGFHAIGVDSSAKALDIARARAAEAGVDVDFRHAAATDLPLEDASVDFACDRGCLHVIDRDLRRAYARELRRVLRPGARFLLRGASAGSDEEGVVAVDEVEIDRWFVGRGFTRGPVVSMDLVAKSGRLAGSLVVLRRGVQ
ncbi:MAG: class I SAM-dependent methyltransferase [bacterium]|nr:class I SAM-dependent methyltransferase [bacterium]